jgi:hypothetical protein
MPSDGSSPGAESRLIAHHAKKGCMKRGKISTMRHQSNIRLHPCKKFAKDGESRVDEQNEECEAAFDL